MPVIDALEFYGPVKNVLRKKMAPAIGKKAYDMLEKEWPRISELVNKVETEILKQKEELLNYCG
jgi:hypothetical protein